MKTLITITCSAILASCAVAPAFAEDNSRAITLGELKQERAQRIEREQLGIGIAGEARDNALLANRRLDVTERNVSTLGNIAEDHEQRLTKNEEVAKDAQTQASIARGTAYNAQASSEAAMQVGQTALDHAGNAQTVADKANAEASRLRR